MIDQKYWILEDYLTNITTAENQGLYNHASWIGKILGEKFSWLSMIDKIWLTKKVQISSDLRSLLEISTWNEKSVTGRKPLLELSLRELKIG